MGPRKRARLFLVVILLIVAACILTLTDNRGRTEVRRAATALVATQRHLSLLRADLQETQAEQSTAASQVQGLDGSISDTQSALATTDASISSTEQGIEIGGIDISDLDTCLGGVTRALDQISVGGTQGAISSLNAVSGSCNAAKPSSG